MLEERAREEFASQAHLGASFPLPPSNHKANWWPHMQHFGAPTRLLDWTESPYVAAYFACEQHLDKDGAVFIVHPFTVTKEVLGSNKTRDISDSVMMSENAPHSVFFFPPSVRSQRAVAQQSHFASGINVLCDHDSIILSKCVNESTGVLNEGLVLKWEIPAILKLVFLQQLRVMNVAAHALFPGLDGLGRSVRDLIRSRLSTPIATPQ
jgi:hypothetical protein